MEGAGAVLKTDTSGGLLWRWQQSSGFHNEWRTSWLVDSALRNSL